MCNILSILFINDKSYYQLIVATCVTNINNLLTIIMRVMWCHFLYRVGMSKLFCSFSVGFNGAFYGGFWFCEGPDKIGYDTLGY